jgi:hypothetical protein
MLYDFLKGNDFEVATTTLTWLWGIRGSVQVEIEDRTPFDLLPKVTLSVYRYTMID